MVQIALLNIMLLTDATRPTDQGLHCLKAVITLIGPIDGIVQIEPFLLDKLLCIFLNCHQVCYQP